MEYKPLTPRFLGIWRLSSGRGVGGLWEGYEKEGEFRSQSGKRFDNVRILVIRG